MTAWFFGDSFEAYTQASDLNGYWDSWDEYHVPYIFICDGRFPLSQALRLGSGNLVKTSNSNDPIHHISLTIRYPQTYLDDARINETIKLYDGSSIQCSLGFDGFGNIKVFSGDVDTTLIGTYAYAVGYVNKWYNFEVEVIIHNTNGSVIIRKNGNTVPDFTLTNVNTRAGSSNNYANKVWLGLDYQNYNSDTDVFLWRSDPTSVPWVGDLRCYGRYPASDSSIAWTASGETIVFQPAPGSAGGVNYSNVVSNDRISYLPFIAPYTGALNSISLNIPSSSSATIQGVIHASSNSLPSGSPIATATSITSPVIGINTFTFSSPITVIQGTQYWFAFQASSDTYISWAYDESGLFHYGRYQPLYSQNFSGITFPATNPSDFTNENQFWMQLTLTPASGINAPMVSNSVLLSSTYISTSSVGNYDFYNLSTISDTPSEIIGIVTRGFIAKSDSGSRVATVQLKSGSTVVQASEPALTMNWSWVWRADQVDPNTGLTWTAEAVDASEIGPILVS